MSGNKMEVMPTISFKKPIYFDNSPIKLKKNGKQGLWTKININMVRSKHRKRFQCCLKKNGK